MAEKEDLSDDEGQSKIINPSNNKVIERENPSEDEEDNLKLNIE